MILFLFVIFLFSANSKKKNNPSIIKSFYPGGQYILLTFDGGPHSILTPKLLDILALYDVKATFFVYGLKAYDHAHITRRIISEGHEVAINGWIRVDYNTLSNDEILNNIVLTSSLIKNLTNTEVNFFRPPLGSARMETIENIQLESSKLKIVLWSINSDDCNIKDSKMITEKVVNNSKPGDILLFHDSISLTIKTMPIIIERLLNQSFEFLTLSEISKLPDDSPH
jgi:peptidoglycan/xylan/chitin deacetylase (PgdA/CDA1 family)